MFDVICTDSEDIALECFEIIEFMVDKKIELVSFLPLYNNMSRSKSNNASSSTLNTILSI